MKKHFTALLSRIAAIPLIRHSSFALAGTVVAGMGNYLFNIIAARLLSEIEFGIFSSILSFLVIVTTIEMTLAYRIANLTATYEEQNNHIALYELYRFTKQKLILIALSLTTLIVFASPFLKNILHLSSVVPIIIMGGIIPFTFSSTLARGFLQGMLKFGQHSISLLVEVAAKITAGTALIFLGFSADAPIIAVGIGAVTAYTTTTYFLYKGKYQFKQNKTQAKEKKLDINKIKWKTVLHNSSATFISVISLTLFYTIDIIAVRYFFGETNPGLVGAYSTISLLGKIIFFAAQSVGATIFPLGSKEHANGNLYPLHLLKQGVGIVLAVGVVISSLYWLVPNPIVAILFGEKYSSIAPLIGIFGITSTIISLLNIFTNYYLAIKKNLIVSIAPLLGILLFLILTFVLHNSLHQIIINLMLGSGSSLVIYCICTISHAIMGRTKKLLEKKYEKYH